VSRGHDTGPGLELDGVEVRYGGAPAITDVSLRVTPGARIGIVGRNGAGKSTLLAAISGAVPLSGGRISWDGQDIARWPVHRRVRAGISVVPEGRRTFGGLTVADNLRVGGFTAPSSVATRRTEVLELFPALATRINLAAAQLSGGEAQMLAIAQALMAGPRVVLLDEPSIGLAPIVVDALLETTMRLREAGIAVLLVEQSVRLAARFADELLVLDRGRLVPAPMTDGEVDEEGLRAAYFGETIELTDLAD
jgi:branched-chain amino acid transport system ATP-binding protein